MRPKSIPAFAREMNELFHLKDGHTYLDAQLMCVTGRLELDIFKLDDLLHERHGMYEQDCKSMSDITIQEYGTQANDFVDLMIDHNITTPPTNGRGFRKKREGCL